MGVSQISLVTHYEQKHTFRLGKPQDAGKDILCDEFMRGVQEADYHAEKVCLSGIREKGVISVTGVWDEGRVKGTKTIKQAYTADVNV